MTSDHAADDDRYPPIGDYALLANGYSAALVSRAGSIDWCCLPRFDAKSVFGRILDWDRGGHFSITPRGIGEVRRRYVDHSLVVETTFQCEGGRARLVDGFGMAHARGDVGRRLGRMFTVDEGTVELDVTVCPRFNYGLLRPWIRGHGPRGWSAVGSDDAFVLTSDVELELDDRTKVLHGGVTLEEGDTAEFAVEVQYPHSLDPRPVHPGGVAALLEDAVEWWREWQGPPHEASPYEGAIRQSAAVLKGLTCFPTGAVVAAPTTSLPERIGGTRNWDYRFSWIRDSSLVLSALYRAGHEDAALGYRNFLLRSSAGDAEDMQLMYDCYGGHELIERELDLEGYRGSRPVRIGNRASRQAQHDVYGYVLNLAEWWDDGTGLDDDEWAFLTTVADRAAEQWQHPDHGIWEVRCDPRHFTHSKAMVWSGLGRAIHIAEQRGEPVHEGWLRAQEEIRRTVEERAVHADGYFTQELDGTAVDAALLHLPHLGFVDVDDERFTATVERIRNDLTTEHGFLLRYDPAVVDDGTGEDREASFVMCTLWLVEVLAAQGEVDEATELFERVLASANDLGLLAEEYDAEEDLLLGNFPQAFSHMALITAAAALEQPGLAARPPSWQGHGREPEGGE